MCNNNIAKIIIIQIHNHAAFFFLCFYLASADEIQKKSLKLIDEATSVLESVVNLQKMFKKLKSEKSDQ